MALATTMMDSTAKLIRPVIGRDSAQGVTQDFTDDATVLVDGEVCSVQQAGMGVVTTYAQRQTNVTTTLYFTRNIGAQVNDIIEVTDVEGNLHTFLVKGFSKNIFTRPLAPYSLDAEEII